MSPSNSLTARTFSIGLERQLLLPSVTLPTSAKRSVDGSRTSLANLVDCNAVNINLFHSKTCSRIEKVKILGASPEAFSK